MKTPLLLCTLCAETRTAFTVTYVEYCVLYKGNTAGGKCWQRRRQVMDTVGQRYIEAGAKTEKKRAREDE